MDALYPEDETIFVTSLLADTEVKTDGLRAAFEKSCGKPLLVKAVSSNKLATQLEKVPRVRVVQDHLEANRLAEGIEVPEQYEDVACSTQPFFEMDRFASKLSTRKLARFFLFSERCSSTQTLLAAANKMDKVPDGTLFLAAVRCSSRRPSVMRKGAIKGDIVSRVWAGPDQRQRARWQCLAEQGRLAAVFAVVQDSSAPCAASALPAVPDRSHSRRVGGRIATQECTGSRVAQVAQRPLARSTLQGRRCHCGHCLCWWRLSRDCRHWTQRVQLCAYCCTKQRRVARRLCRKLRLLGTRCRVTSRGPQSTAM
ncbi:MAG: hypothetical protein MHM6MM_005489 [Cercozoa sp. M6MM]